MRPFLRLVTGLVVVALVFAGVYWYLDRRSDPVPGPGVAAPGPSEPSRATEPAPTPTTTAPPGLPLPLLPRPVRIAWAGDSIAGSLADAVAAEGAARGVEVLRMATPGCGMVRGLPADDSLTAIPWAAACDGSIATHNREVAATGADVVTWLSTWETANRIVDGQGYEFGTPDGDAVLLALIDESAQQLTAGGARLVFLTMAPNTTGPRRPTVDPVADQRALHLDELLRTYARAHPDRVAVLDLAAVVCPSGPPCPTEVEGVTLRPDDGGHFAGDGPAWVAPRIFDRLLG